MKIYNSLKREKEEFVPLNEGVVNMYVCGPTVYNFFHIGNARPFVVFDAFRNYLEYKGYKVNYIQNFTDVDDKIIKRANEEGVEPSEIAKKYTEEYFKDADALGVKRATKHPTVTENIDNIIDFIKVLIEKGYAYEVDGDVYFDTNSFEDYGSLSNQDTESLHSGVRIDVNEDKKDQLDFTLWKKKKPGEPSWDSPWGEGRPGWHIECSVMSTTYLGDTIDIHAGGQDLIFPHHENEIAQSEAKTGKKYVKYWMHNGYLNIDNEKMSKSKGNFFTVREILEKYSPDVIRYFLLTAHYRNPINFSEDLIKSAKNALERLYNVRNNLEHLYENTASGELNKELKKEFDAYKEGFIEKLDNDFNTADGISVIFELGKKLNTDLNGDSSKETVKYGLDLFNELTEVLRIADREQKDIDEEIKELIDQRQKARKNKNYELADEIRDNLLERGIELMDTPDGVKWRYIDK